MFVKLVIGTYIYYNFSKLFRSTNAAVETKILSLDVAALPEIHWNDTRTNLFWVLRNTKDELKPFDLDQENLDQYFELSVVKWESNWNLP